MSIPTKSALITVAHGLAGWALCGATMGIGMASTTLDNALLIHAAAAPRFDLMPLVFPNPSGFKGEALGEHSAERFEVVPV